MADAGEGLIDAQNRIRWIKPEGAFYGFLHMDGLTDSLKFAQDLVKKARVRLFGSWEMNWMAYNFSHDVALPGSSGPPVGFPDDLLDVRVVLPCACQSQQRVLP